MSTRAWLRHGWLATASTLAAALSVPTTRCDWKKLPNPERMMEPTHVLQSLLKPRLVERYDVYHNGTTSVKAHVTLGSELDGHKGLVHGGLVSLLVDDVLGFGFFNLGIPKAVTAFLHINYVQGVPANSKVVILVTLEEWERRKIFWKFQVLDEETETELCNGTSLYIIPRDVYDEYKDELEQRAEQSNGGE